MSKERREFDRHIPLEQHNLFYTKSNQLFGTVANISTGGFLLLTSDKLEEGTILTLSFEMKNKTPVISISFSATILWQSSASSENSYWCGVHIIDIKNKDEILLSEYTSSMKLAD